MLLPHTGIVPVLLPDVTNSGDLHIVRPTRGTLDCQTISDIHADVSRSPHHFAGVNLVPPGRSSVLASLNHGISALVRYAVGGVLRTTIGLSFITSPAPQNGFDKVHTVKAEGVRGRRHNHRGTSCRHVVGVVLDIPRLVCVGQRRTKAPHDIQGLVVLGNINNLGDQFT